MTPASITSTDSFATRAQRSEATRVVLWIMVLVGMLLLTVVRRWTGGVVMTEGKVFFPYAGVLLLAIVCQVVLLNLVRSANRRGVLLPGWLWRAGAIFDLGVALALMAIAGFFSPRGPVPALSAPQLLLVPMVLLMSVLRLRPDFTLHAGLTAAAIHILLTVRAIMVSHAVPEAYPVYFAYGFILLLTAVVAMFVARELRRHVREAADEAAAHERADQSLALIQRDLAVARDIQTGLLPTAAPKFDGFEIAGMSRPADLTGGDYYDWQLMPDGRLITVMADVTGHGIGPALVMAVCRAYARASAVSISDPAPLMRRINELLHADLPAGRFITIAIAMIEPSGRVQLVSAGHGPSFLYNARSGAIERFGGDGLPLGVSTAEEYDPPATFEMGQDDVLVLLTDGFFEWQRDGDDEQFGIARLEQVIASHVAHAPGAILSAMDEAVRAFAVGSKQQDDMTAVVIKRTAPARDDRARVAQPSPADAAAATPATG